MIIYLTLFSHCTLIGGSTLGGGPQALTAKSAEMIIKALETTYPAVMKNFHVVSGPQPQLTN